MVFAIFPLFFIAFLLMPELAHAQILGIELNSLGTACTGGTSSNNLFENRTGDLVLDKTGVCSSQGNSGFFARFFCLMETTLGLVLSKTFCAIRDAWMAPFGAIMMLLMAVTGIGFVLGIIQFTVKEVSALIFKMALVTLFVMNADVALDIAYALFLAIMKGTVTMMKDGFISMATNTNVEFSFVKSGGELTTSVVDTLGGGNAFGKIDADFGNLMSALLKGSTGGYEGCSVFSLLLMLIFILPFAMMLIMFAIITFGAFFARAAYGYIYALAMVTFLIAAMPIFVSFALFKSTSDLFEHWLKYIGSNVIQIFIVFAIMAFAAMIDFMDFLKQLNALIVPYNLTFNFGPFGEWELTSGCWFCCSICEPRFVPSTAFPGILLLPPVPASGVITASDVCVDPNKAIPWLKIPNQEKLLKFLFINGAALYILTKVMDDFMKLGPDIARLLGGARLVQTIGGISAMGGRGIQSAVHRGSVRFEKGFEKAWKDDDEDDGSIRKGNSFSKVWRASKRATSDAIDNEFDFSDRKKVDLNDLAPQMERYKAAYATQQKRVELANKGHVPRDQLIGGQVELNMARKELQTEYERLRLPWIKGFTEFEKMVTGETPVAAKAFDLEGPKH